MSFAGSRRGLVFQWWVMPVLSYRCRECPQADGGRRSTKRRNTLIPVRLFANNVLCPPQQTFSVRKVWRSGQTIHFDDLGHCFTTATTHTKRLVLAALLFRPLGRRLGGVWHDLRTFQRRLSTSNVFFFIHYSGFRFRYLLRLLLFFWQMKTIVGWASGRLVECEVNMSRYFVMSESPHLL